MLPRNKHIFTVNDLYCLSELQFNECNTMIDLTERYGPIVMAEKNGGLCICIDYIVQNSCIPRE